MEMTSEAMGLDAVSMSGLLQDPDRIASGDDSRKVQVAKDFESVLLSKWLDQMKETIVDWSDDKDAASKQVDDIFWQYLAKDMSDQGGLGLWKDIYRSIETPSGQADQVFVTG